MIVMRDVMKKDHTMLKNSFMTGAFVTTLGIVITKILGILYVIPFHSIIGETGGALYGYAYTIYLLFMSLSSAGIPLAISKLVSEYQTLGYYSAKKRAFVICKRIALLLGFVCFIILMLFAPLIAKAVLGELTGGNTISDVVFVIRVMATAILIVPVLSIYRGYFEGHRFMRPPSISQVIEQLVRIIVIIAGSYLALNVFKLSLTSSVAVAVFGATVGAVVSCLYLIIKKKKNSGKFNEKIRTINEPIITDKQILKKIVVYALPFIMIDVFKSLYNYIDMTTVVKGLVSYAKFSVLDAESIMSMLSTWSNKFNMIVLSVSTGVIVSLIPNLTQSVVKKDKKDINKKITQALNILFFLTVPMTVGISFLAKPIWTLFYGDSLYGSSVLAYFIFAGLMMGLFTAMVSIVQTLRDYKTVFISLLVGVLLKLFLNNNLISAFYKMGLPAYYGVITASIIGYLISFIICLAVLHYRYDVNYEEVVKNFIDIISGTVVMIVVLFLFKFVVPIVSPIRFVNLFIIFAYTLVGCFTYLLFAYKLGIVKRIFGNKFSLFRQKK